MMPEYPLNQNEIQNAFRIWSRNYNFKSTDVLVEPFLDSRIKSFNPDEKMSWLEMGRTALFISTTATAKKLSITSPSYCALEENERNGKITLTKLAQAADALDCELVYAIRPKTKNNFSYSIWNKIFPEAEKHPWIKACDPKRKDRALAATAVRLMQNGQFKRSQEWSQQANKNGDEN